MAVEAVILKGGHLIDPKNKINGIYDLVIRDGKIFDVGKNIEIEGVHRTIDLKGLFVSPGIVDIHNHLFASAGNPAAWAGDYSVYPDGFSFRSGVTTMVDAGSSGWRNFEAFKATVIDRAQTKVFAFLNIASFGMISDMIEQYEDDFDPSITASMVNKYCDILVGIKSAHYWHPGWASVERAVEAGELSGVPAMIDFGYFKKERPYWQLVTEKLRPGDISTHCFRGPVPIADANGKLYSYLIEAREKGVLFDLGHGCGSFPFKNAVPAFREGFYPDSISSDLHVLSMNAGMMDMPTTMSKCLALGMDLESVILHSTYIPAKMISHPELGHLSRGAAADIAVWHLAEGDFGYKDSFGKVIRSNRRLFCEMTLLNGETVWDMNGRDGIIFDESDNCLDGIREGEYLILPPAQ